MQNYFFFRVNKAFIHSFIHSLSGERPGLQRRLHHEAPHSKYVNCRNHRLALVFVHRMPQFKRLREVDATVLALWKAFKYSSIKASVFKYAQEAEGLEKLKLLKVQLTRWLSHECVLMVLPPYVSLTDLSQLYTVLMK